MLRPHASVEIEWSTCSTATFSSPLSELFSSPENARESFLAWAMTWWTWTNLIMFRYAIFFRPSSSAICCTNTFTTLLTEFLECFGGNLREKFRKFFWNRFAALTFPRHFPWNFRSDVNGFGFELVWWVDWCADRWMRCRRSKLSEFRCHLHETLSRSEDYFLIQLENFRFPGVFHQQSMRDGESKSGDSEAFLGVWHPSASAMSCLDFE